jgi:mRNA deadenylase 3'-5' endonuclease subunit Ccr4
MKALGPLPVRSLKFLGPHRDPNHLAGSISVMSFNILAQCYTRSEFFPSVNPKAALKWKNRGPKIVQEIAQYNPDVVCLQECDSWNEFISPELEPHGYTGVFKQKTDGKQDGVAILWKKDRFVLQESDPIEYGIRTGVGLIVSLSPVSSAASTAETSDNAIVFANTHLFWDPEVEFIKLRQSQILLARAYQVPYPAWQQQARCHRKRPSQSRIARPRIQTPALAAA